MRLFAAVLPPPAAVTALAAALDPLHALPGARALRWTAPQGWHYTLGFLGEVPDGVRPGLDERLARAAHRHQPCEVRTAGGGRFGDRALWTGAEGDLRALSALADTVRAAARRAGAPCDEEHGFRAHLTLARTSKNAPVDLRPFAAALTDHRGTWWRADTLSLVASTLPSSGVPGEQPAYTVVAAWPLGGPADRPERGAPGTAG
ncbi:RNA 2',3'-cyclic phosphodiesterase [Actinacidiphila paucisporea]|uniref:RNA 2',3'-cyclic phosphodiesterase n=1 Tax=Actinacidiphila paucisporea TaxID=310782 RepID=A0A1M7EMM0_9ACTN|nr:RNA 2',3'-cyclic phosphodiesterase [Actinacidiphila paucisporea]SHL92940.1 2'-5' RNA ligase [Actinacidiphila paucisporea]